MPETTSLESLATRALERLERNKELNNTETNGQNLVSRPNCDETKKQGELESTFTLLTDLQHTYQERLAIAEYDGQQKPLHAERIAYLDVFTAVLNALPHGDISEEEWLNQRLKNTR